MPRKVNYRKKADALIQAIGVARNKHCLVCGGKCEVMHHYIPKSLSTNLRYNWSNLIPLCHSCHFSHHTKGNPKIMETILQKKGQAWADNLNAHRLGAKSNASFYRSAYEDLLLESAK